MRIRTPRLYLGWLPVEIEIGERTLKMVAGFSVHPQTNEAEAYRYLLALNMKAPGFSFGMDAENRICLVGRIPLDDLDAPALDAAFGRIVEITESAVASYLQLGFAKALPEERSSNPGTFDAGSASETAKTWNGHIERTRH